MTTFESYITTIEKLRARVAELESGLLRAYLRGLIGAGGAIERLLPPHLPNCASLPANEGNTCDCRREQLKALESGSDE